MHLRARRDYFRCYFSHLRRYLMRRFICRRREHYRRLLHALSRHIVYSRVIIMSLDAFILFPVVLRSIMIFYFVERLHIDAEARDSESRDISCACDAFDAEFTPLFCERDELAARLRRADAPMILRWQR